MQPGSNIRKLRFERDEMSREELSEAAGVTRQMIHAIVNGKFVPPPLLAFRIAPSSGKSCEEIF